MLWMAVSISNIDGASVLTRVISPTLGKSCREVGGLVDTTNIFEMLDLAFQLVSRVGKQLSRLRVT